jgi:hypothetical protein
MKHKPVSAGGDLAGITAIPFRCTKLADNTQSEAWLHDYEADNGSGWTNFRYT